MHPTVLLYPANMGLPFPVISWSRMTAGTLVLFSDRKVGGKRKRGGEKGHIPPKRD